jgi:hypothetical protein
MTVQGNPNGVVAVCEEAKWDAMERDRPGQHQLICRGIANETEAEKLARSQPGATPVAGVRLKGR